MASILAGVFTAVKVGEAFGAKLIAMSVPLSLCSDAKTPGGAVRFPYEVNAARATDSNSSRNFTGDVRSHFGVAQDLGRLVVAGRPSNTPPRRRYGNFMHVRRQVELRSCATGDGNAMVYGGAPATLTKPPNATGDAGVVAPATTTVFPVICGTLTLTCCPGVLATRLRQQ